MSTKLILASGKHAGIEAKLESGFYMIGRHQECQIRPRTHKVSRRHCLVHNRDSSTRVYDLGSSNGTFVNEHRLCPNEWKSLEDGDTLRCGGVVFRVSRPSDVAKSLPKLSQTGGTSSPEGPGFISVRSEAIEDFDICAFLEAEDERARKANQNKKTPLKWDPNRSDENQEASVDVLDDEEEYSEGASGINTHLDSLRGDKNAQKMLEQLREGATEEDIYQVLRTQRIAEIRERIRLQRESQPKPKFKLHRPDKNSRKQPSRKVTFTSIAAGLLICIALIAVAYFAYA